MLTHFLFILSTYYIFLICVTYIRYTLFDEEELAEATGFRFYAVFDKFECEVVMNVVKFLL